MDSCGIGLWPVADPVTCPGVSGRTRLYDFELEPEVRDWLDAAAAEVSPASFSLYFPTKEDGVTSDGLDVPVSESFSEPPARPVPGRRGAAVASVLAALPAAELARLCSSAELGMSSHQAGEFARTAGVLAAAVAQRDDREHDDFTDRILGLARLIGGDHGGGHTRAGAGWGGGVQTCQPGWMRLWPAWKPT